MIRFATPVYNLLEHRLPSRLIQALNRLSMSRPTGSSNSHWKPLLTQMAINTCVYSILSVAVLTVMFTIIMPFAKQLAPTWCETWYFNAAMGVITVLLISPFLRAMVMKKNHSEEWKALWKESNRNRLPLLFTFLVRVVIAVGFIFNICNYLFHYTPAIMITVGFVAVILIVLSRQTKRNSIMLERLFINNLRSRDIEAQVHGKKRPLYEGRLLDRDIHIADFDVPANSRWMGQTLRQLNLGRKFGVHVSSILRGGFRLNIPDGDYIIFPHDRLQAIGSDEQLAKLSAAIESEVIAEDGDVEKREMKLQQLIIGGDSPFIGKTLQESDIRRAFSIMVVGLEEGKENLSPFPPNRKFMEGDIIWVVGEQASLDALHKKEGHKA